MEFKDFTFGLADYLVFGFMLITSTSVGIYFGFFAKSKNSPDEYLMGSRKMKTIPIAISLVASQISAISIMSIPGEVYAFGMNYFFNAISMLPAIPIISCIIAPVFYDNHFRNCYEYLEKRFNKTARKLVTASFILNSSLLMPVYMFIPSLAFTQVSGLNIHVINTLVCSICVFYTMLGGIKAVVWSDVLQAGIMLGSMFFVGIMGTIKTGGVGKVIEYASADGRLEPYTSWDPRIRITLWNTLFSGIVFWTGHVGLHQSCVQRIVSLPSIKHAKKSIIIAGLGIVFVVGFNCFIGIIMYAYYHNCDPILAGHVEKADKLMPFFVEDIIGHLSGMPGIFISCVFSASLSTLSANFNSLAGIIYFDYVKPFVKHTDAKANYIMKMSVVVMGFYCIAGGFVVEQFSSILQMLITLTGITTGAIAGLFMLGMFVPRVNGKVALIAFSLTILTMSWIIFNTQMRFHNGILQYDTLPTRIDGCEDLNISILRPNITVKDFNSHPYEYFENRSFSIFEISFHWYKLIGAVVMGILGISLSFICKSDNTEKLDPKLYSQFIRKFIKQQNIKMEEGEPLKERPDICDNLEKTSK